MSKKSVGVAILTLAVSVLSTGQLNAQRGRWAKAECKLNKSHFLLNSALIYLKTATRSGSEREKHLRDANRVLTQALNNGKADAGTAWYLLGRYYEMKRDLKGMDTAYARAAELRPDCAQDIDKHRRSVWVPILNQGVQAYEANDVEQALESFRKANALYDKEPQSFFYMASLMANRLKQTDSAAYYYRKAAELAKGKEEANEIELTSTFNLARLYHAEKNWDSAIVWYKRHRQLDPENTETLVGLATVYARKAEDSDKSGDSTTAAALRASALTMYDSVLAAADKMSAVNLFSTGVSLYKANRYDIAAQAFQKGYEKNPYFRDGIFNLANTYLSLARAQEKGAAGDSVKKAAGEKMLPVVLKLMELDPHNQSVRRLLAAAYQLLDLPDSTLAALQSIEAMKFDVAVMLFQPREGGYTLGGSVSNLTEDEVTVPTITFEFLDGEGNVVASEPVEAGTLEGDGYFEFSLSPSGENIAGWRYRVGDDATASSTGS